MGSFTVQVYLEKFTIGNVSVVVEVVDAEGKLQPRLVVGLSAELGHANNELLEVQLSTTVGVEDLHDPLGEWIGLQLGQFHQLLQAH